jgi:hypothetical protein
MENMMIPGRASDAGPDDNGGSVINRQSLYSLLVDEALEEVRDLDRLYLDDRRLEQRRRLEAIDRAIDALLKTREVV